MSDGATAHGAPLTVPGLAPGGASTDPASAERVRAATGHTPAGVFDHDKIRQAVTLLFEAIGEDPARPGIAETPDRVARMIDEIFAGMLVDPADVLNVTFEEDHDDLVLQRDIPFVSVCEHHLVPWFGTAHVGYLPSVDGAVTGLSKLSRVVDLAAKRPGLQERMTTIIANALEQRLHPRGVLVVIEARHLCMEMRGIRKPGATTLTSTMRGIFREDPRTRAEALSLIRRS